MASRSWHNGKTIEQRQEWINLTSGCLGNVSGGSRMACRHNLKKFPPHDCAGKHRKVKCLQGMVDVDQKVQGRSYFLTV